jgi:hypothetical protein
VTWRVSPLARSSDQIDSRNYKPFIQLNSKRNISMISISTILLVVLILLLLGVLPTWSHSRNWGYFPSGGLGLVVLVLVVLVLMGRI